MLLWALMAVLTAVALGAVLQPLLRRSEARQRSDHDLAVYRAQLTEIDSDVERGQIGFADAEAARAEIARRLLQVTGQPVQSAPSVPQAAPLKVRRASALAMLLLTPALALGLYIANGRPDDPDQPLRARLTAPAEDSRIDILIAQVEERLRATPDDGEGWDVIAPVYFKNGQFVEAANAYSKAGLLLGETPERLEGFGESLAMVSNGIVNDRVKAVFERAVQIDPSRMKPRLWLALAKEQEGKTAAALADYRAIQKSLVGPSPMAGVVASRIAELSAMVTGAATAKGPTLDDVESASALPEADRKAMIEGMVAQLAERLKADAKDIDGWLRLTRSYVVLGNRQQALVSLATARKTFGSEPAALQRLDELARELKL